MKREWEIRAEPKLIANSVVGSGNYNTAVGFHAKAEATVSDPSLGSVSYDIYAECTSTAKLSGDVTTNSWEDDLTAKADESTAGMVEKPKNPPKVKDAKAILNTTLPLNTLMGAKLEFTSIAKARGVPVYNEKASCSVASDGINIYFDISSLQ